MNLNNKDIWLGIGVIAFGVMLLTVAIPDHVSSPSNVRALVLSPTFWPTIVAYMIVMLGGVLVASRMIRTGRLSASDEPWNGDGIGDELIHGWARLSAMAVLMVGLVVATPILGMVLASVIAFAAFSIIVLSPRPVTSLIVAIVLPLVLYAFFTHVAGVVRAARKVPYAAMNLFDNLAAAWPLVANFESFLALAGGIVIGVVAGAIPGMSATMAVALTLPFTFALQPITGILLLLGVYKGGIFGGSIPAILIKTPGTPASSATILDGYPMAENGQAGKALGMALYASCTADVISNLSLILFAGWLASFALSFGPPEFFTLILFSLTIIAGVSGDSLIKGLLSAVFGLLLATVGLDLVYGTNRFTFNDPNLMGGLNFIAVLIGLFAIPEILAYVWQPRRRQRHRAGAWRAARNVRGVPQMLPFHYPRQFYRCVPRQHSWYRRGPCSLLVLQ